jgi:hypothetical protein
MRFVKRSMNPPIRVYLEHIDRGVCVSEVGLTKHIVTGFQKIHVRWGSTAGITPWNNLNW